MENAESVEQLIEENKGLLEEYNIITDEKITYDDLYNTIEFLNKLEEQSTIVVETKDLHCSCKNNLARDLLF